MDFKFVLLSRLNFSTAFSTNAVSICHSVNLTDVTRIEFSTRYLIHFKLAHQGAGDAPFLEKEIEEAMVGSLHDCMTQCRYLKPITSFELSISPEQVHEVDILGQGKAALEQANADLGTSLLLLLRL